MLNFMSSESQPRRTEHSRLQKILAASAVVLGLSSCANPAEPQPYKATPNMVGFLKPGDDKHCFNGGERPCAVLLRTKPNVSAAKINATEDQKEVLWPREAYNGKKGDTLTVLCYDPNGQKITSYENNLVSADWYKVVVPAEHVTNTEALPDSFNLNGTKAYIGWASVTWFNQSAHEASVPRC
jgi:hypothetical protein